MKGFVISLDLMIAFGVILTILYTINEVPKLEHSRFSTVSDALKIIDHIGIENDLVGINTTIHRILPFESFSFQLIDFGDMDPITYCSTDADCTDPNYPNCTHYICANQTLTIKTGEYLDYQENYTRMCSQQMIDAGACKPQGDSAQRIILIKNDDLVKNFVIARLEVAR